MRSSGSEPSHTDARTHPSPTPNLLHTYIGHPLAKLAPQKEEQQETTITILVPSCPRKSDVRNVMSEYQ